jgi:hypothetical protein
LVADAMVANSGVTYKTSFRYLAHIIFYDKLCRENGVTEGVDVSENKSMMGTMRLVAVFTHAIKEIIQKRYISASSRTISTTASQGH